MEKHEYKYALENNKKALEEIEALIEVESLKADIETIEKKTFENNFWDDHESAQKVIVALKQKKQRLTKYEELSELYETLEVGLELMDMGETDEGLETEFNRFTRLKESLETHLLLSESYDSLNAVIEIHPGAGGTESQDWANMLYRMYTRYAEKENFALEVNDYLDGQEAGIKSVTFTVSGSFAFGLLKGESGVHRLVRISPFDTGARRHTSFASVNVIPEIDDTIVIDINESDLKIDTYRSSGAGGQSVNTTDSAVRITHLPTKLTVTCQNERSQIKNREKAMKMLKSKMYQVELEKQSERVQEHRNQNQSNAFGSQIRSYVMHPYAMVKDHRTSTETGNVQKVMDGEIDAFIHAYLKHAMKKEE